MWGESSNGMEAVAYRTPLLSSPEWQTVQSNVVLTSWQMYWEAKGAQSSAKPVILQQRLHLSCPYWPVLPSVTVPATSFTQLICEYYFFSPPTIPLPTPIETTSQTRQDPKALTIANHI